MTNERTGRLMFASVGVLFFVPFLSLVLPTLISSGEREEAVGVVDYVKIRTNQSGTYCDLYILVNKQELVHTASKMDFCEARFSKGEQLIFSYRKNLYGKISADTIQISDFRGFERAPSYLREGP